MNYNTRKCLERIKEDTIAHTKKNTIISIDKDDRGFFIKSIDEDSVVLTARIKGDKFVFYKNGKFSNDCDAEYLIGMAKAILRLAKAEEFKTEDGTSSDLGAIPTGHVVHDIDDEDEEW